jgi:FtsZ-binding cell division protein ZapB
MLGISKTEATLQAEIEQLKNDLELRNQTASDRLQALKTLEPELERLQQREWMRALDSLGGTRTRWLTYRLDR